MRIASMILAAGVFAAGFAVAQAPESTRARSIAANCTGCHGPGGVSQGTIASLAGMPKEDIVRKVQDFKAGRAPATVMQQLAKGYTDEQIELAAGWFAAQKAAK